MSAIIAASIAAGPLFWLCVALMGLSSGMTDMSGEFGWFAIRSIPVGAFFAFLPNLIGTAGMTALGSRFKPAQSPFAWIGAGAVGGLVVAVILTGTRLPDPYIAAAMVLTGMACAAICRAFTRWPDEADGAQA
jgi:hypothetical protein